MGEPIRDRGQSATLGVVLLLAITVVSVGVITAAGGIAVDDTRTNIRETAVENALYQYDAALSEVVYGSADQRRVGLGDAGEGSYAVRPDAGEIRVEHRNYTEGADETVINRTLGAFVYADGDTEIAAQGGAVFRRDGEGSVLLSAPQMRYTDSTFTAPVIGLRNGGERASATQQVRALLTGTSPTEVRYPNRERTYGESDKPYANPVSSGEIAVVVESDYYTAWASYFRKIDPSVNVTVEADAKRATLVLPTHPVRGDSVALGDRQSLRGINESKHAVNEMNITFPGQNANWNSFDAGTVEIDGFRGTYTVAFENQGKGDGGPCDDEVTVGVTATYESDGGSVEQTWSLDDAFQESSGAFTYGCPDGQYELYLDLTGDTELGYDSSDPATFDHHEADGNTTYATGDEERIGNLTGHYVALAGGNTNLEVGAEKDRGKSSIDPDAATGRIDYDSSAVITYLRVTNTTVNTTLS